jgi:hypothetical protein
VVVIRNTARVTVIIIKEADTNDRWGSNTVCVRMREYVYGTVQCQGGTVVSGCGCMVTMYDDDNDAAVISMYGVF